MTFIHVSKKDEIAAISWLFFAKEKSQSQFQFQVSNTIRLHSFTFIHITVAKLFKLLKSKEYMISY